MYKLYFARNYFSTAIALTLRRHGNFELHTAAGTIILNASLKYVRKRHISGSALTFK